LQTMNRYAYMLVWVCSRLYSYLTNNDF